MGLVHAKVTLSNPRWPDIEPVEVEGLVDTGAVSLCIPEHLATHLQLELLEERKVTVADGREVTCRYAGPIHVEFQNRHCFAGALVLGTSVLLGAILLEDMDLVIDPTTRTLAVNPKSPNIPSTIVMSPRSAR